MLRTRQEGQLGGPGQASARQEGQPVDQNRPQTGFGLGLPGRKWRAT